MCIRVGALSDRLAVSFCLTYDKNKARLWTGVCVGKVIHSMVAHLDAVTSLAIDPSGLYLLSGSEYFQVIATG